MVDSELIACLEAVLFATGEPIEIEKMSLALQEDETILRNTLNILAEKYKSPDSGLCLLRLENKYQLCTKKQYADSIRSVIDAKKNAPLSQAALEVLAIIAYNQPVTKAFIEQVRGVDCSSVISTLYQKSLIEERGRLELPGRPLVYGTTPDFLRCFCLEDLDSLPPLPQKQENNENNLSDLQIRVDENKNIE